MAKLIFKAPYYKPGHRTESGKSRGGYAEYIATREGVEILRGGMLGYIGERQGSNGLFSDEGVQINLSMTYNPSTTLWISMYVYSGPSADHRWTNAHSLIMPFSHERGYMHGAV